MHLNSFGPSPEEARACDRTSVGCKKWTSIFGRANTVDQVWGEGLSHVIKMHKSHQLGSANWGLSPEGWVNHLTCPQFDSVKPPSGSFATCECGHSVDPHISQAGVDRGLNFR
jgi:hypothetical protein